MTPWERLAASSTPDGADLTLWRRGDELVVRIRGEELMSNRRFGSEEHLAEVACEGLPSGARVLVGGLGLGFTLRRTLALVDARAEVVVAELVPELAAWLRDHLGAGALLDDPRVRLAFGDVGGLLREASNAFDAIMLDVDNGPSALTSPGNRSLYSARGLAATRGALHPGGRLVVWSAGADDAFLDRLGRAGFRARVVHTRARRDKGPRHCLFVGDAR
jgi:spermidine synthase